MIETRHSWQIARFPAKLAAYLRMGVPRARARLGALSKGVLEQVADPVPAPGPHDVVVAVDAVSLNFRDYAIALGLYDPDQALPLVPASDAVGRVVATGSDATEWQVGERVLTNYMKGWMDGPGTADKQVATLGSPEPGVLSTHIVQPQTNLVAPPDHLDDFEACALPVAGVTAWAALTTLAGAKACDTLLVQGSGGVSLFGILLGKALGLRVIATTGGPGKVDRLRALGADEVLVVNYKGQWSDLVREATGGRGVDIVLDVGGGPSVAQSVKACAHGGRVLCIGFLGGVAPKLSLETLILNNVSVRGVTVGSKADLAALCTFIREHDIRPPIDRVFPFADVPEAFEHLANGRHFGKVCVDVSGRNAAVANTAQA